MNRQTPYFFLTAIVYGLIVILGAIYVFARLDFVRTGKPLQKLDARDH